MLFMLTKSTFSGGISMALTGSVNKLNINEVYSLDIKLELEC